MSITETADAFFAACETGKGWAGCRAYCTPDASFVAQAEPLAEIRTLEAYCDWMAGLLGFIPNGSYAIKAFATDEARRSVCAYGVFSGTHSGEGGPCPPTGQDDAHRLCLCDGIHRRQDPPHDQDLECRLGDARTRLGMSRLRAPNEAHHRLEFLDQGQPAGQVARREADQARIVRDLDRTGIGTEA